MGNPTSIIEHQLNFLNSADDTKEPSQRSLKRLAIPGVFGSIGLLIMAVAVPFTMPAFRRLCLPYVPATDAQVQNVMSCLKTNGKRTLVDLGSGDGRIIFAAAEKGFNCTGIELNPWLVLYSKVMARRKKLSKLARFERKDLWKTDLTAYDYVVIFGVEQMMPALGQKIIAELHSGREHRVIACRFPLPNQKPCRVVGTGIDTVWLYKYSGS